MPQSDIKQLRSAIQGRWSGNPSIKAHRYVDSFFSQTRTGQKITAQVEGNHGVYTVSIQVDTGRLSAACSCYIGRDGWCHHCEALAFAFLQSDVPFEEIETKKLEDIHDI